MFVKVRKLSGGRCSAVAWNLKHRATSHPSVSIMASMGDDPMRRAWILGLGLAALGLLLPPLQAAPLGEGASRLCDPRADAPSSVTVRLVEPRHPWWVGRVAFVVEAGS